MMRWFVGACALLVSAAWPAAQAPQKHFLWTVSAPGAPPSYLLGSLHVLTADHYPLADAVENAFKAASVFIAEADIDELSNGDTLRELARKALLPDGKTLGEVVGVDLYRDVVARASKLGVPEAALNRLKPWMVALTLTMPAMQAAGFQAEHGVDRHFFERAKKAGMERRALETVAFQFDRLDQMSAEEQEAMLRATLDDLDRQVVNVKRLAEAWSRGDAAALERLLYDEPAMSPGLRKRLLTDRNAAWVSSVESCIRQRTSCFVVVGAAHLVGPDSLVALLQQKGYRVEQQ